ncbi:uncharacterized protein BJ212DRAFT_555884 [Suillus subaureus]|uniref:Uncharacterized protein n=1 Tax=Suillus subaureus TaxID=48587 RepID=A0A9P7EMD1_9AGAM|nr:uncharacterized protein BJ212DRAFT_555884 [Suillus subaureus]KAG1824935.1 hypothetical protein BJ212DRAFT_555884 [Suillus subaureus]
MIYHHDGRSSYYSYSIFMALSLNNDLRMIISDAHPSHGLSIILQSYYSSAACAYINVLSSLCIGFMLYTSLNQE